MKKGRMIFISVLLLGLAFWLVSTLKEFESRIIKERINLDFQVIETKKVQGFQDGPSFFNLILLDASDYQRLSEDWKAQPSHTFDGTTFFNMFTVFSEAESYQKIENNDFQSFSSFKFKSKGQTGGEYYFFMGDGKIAAFSWTD